MFVYWAEINGHRDSEELAAVSIKANVTQVQAAALRSVWNKLKFIIPVRKVTADTQLWLYLHTCTVSPADPGSAQQTAAVRSQTTETRGRSTEELHKLTVSIYRTKPPEVTTETLTDA